MRRVIIETPYVIGNVSLNARYARACLNDALTKHDEAPFSIHALYTQPTLSYYGARPPMQ